MDEHDVTSADGTRIRVWRTDREGPTVLLCPGLGTIPEAWPALLLPESGVRTLSWYHRGTMGSQRPADPKRIKLADHVADAIAVLDDAGIDRCIVMGWSFGVTVACELALRYPDRVSGLMLVAGAPGDLFGAIFGVPGIPESVRRTFAVAGTTALKVGGGLGNLLLHNVPINDVTTFLARHSGFLLPGAGQADVRKTLDRFRTHDWRWYFTLALALADIPRQDLSGISCPTTVIAGKYDALVSLDSMTRPTATLPQAKLRVLAASHFVPLEAPEVISEELEELVERVDAVHRALENT
ncbi:alpha/beta hydrolase [Pseudonocardiaceae bacterium YIM PH 21723]|nr:alpha/beta hydrolase [Pseudonocardiaceae bacterium YIM PH 21723]